MKASSLTPMLFAFFACAALPHTDTHPAIGDTVTSVQAPRVEREHRGESVEIPVPGKVTVVDFWMTFCEPCVEALPELEGIWSRVDKSEVAFVGVSVDPEEAVTENTLHETLSVKLTFPTVFDGKDAVLQTVYQLGGTVPATFVLDKKGCIRFFFDGSEGDIDELERAIRLLAAE